MAAFRWRDFSWWKWRAETRAFIPNRCDHHVFIFVRTDPSWLVKKVCGPYKRRGWGEF